ncbi:MAG: TIGR04255 family protein [Alphaproteobacteria bacterium]|nr:TIGR04255 family protein [Alphaproteobacteria bacterium]
MPSKELKKKPLVEAILEVRWALQKQPGDMQVDPHYKFLLGRMFDRVLGEYPVPEELPQTVIPDEMSAYMVKQRFRVGANDWPLIQIGPGIMTVNDTAKYTWPDFRSRSIAAVAKLFDAYPKGGSLKITSLILWYIDAVEVDFTKLGVWDFMREKLKLSTSLPDTLFADGTVQRMPRHFHWEAAFDCAKPSGVISLRFVTREKEGKRSLVWETVVRSESDLPSLPDGFAGWIDAAHAVTSSDPWGKGFGTRPVIIAGIRRIGQVHAAPGSPFVQVIVAGIRRIGQVAGVILAIATSPATAIPDLWWDRRRRDEVTVTWIVQPAVGRPVSRSEALRIVRQILERAEQERLEAAEAEASRGLQWGDDI